jgi:hypothetical protein
MLMPIIKNGKVTNACSCALRFGRDLQLWAMERCFKIFLTSLNLNLEANFFCLPSPPGRNPDFAQDIHEVCVASSGRPCMLGGL